MKKMLLPVVLLPALLSADARAGSSERAYGAELLQPFKQQLMGALKTGLQQGPEQAIDACKMAAPRIASERSVDGVEMGRASHRLRNPVNAAPGWVRPVLDGYLAHESAAISAVEVSAGEGRQGYVEPIFMQAAPCLMCHGETLAPAVAEKIRALYPNDQATGFVEGDLRGVFWVSWPTEQ
ncbi:MAG: c-type heme family protein [Lysobacterales bacterium]|jgi:hypothetical protein